MSAPEPYLPVPRNKREENSVPAMTKEDGFIFNYQCELIGLADDERAVSRLALPE